MDINIQDVELDDEHIPLTRAQRVAQAIERLPKLNLQEIPCPDDSCPVCLNSFIAIYKGEVQNEGTGALTCAVAPKLIELSGVTRLEMCGHVFCRVDLIEWIRSGHGTCPACRHAFADIRPVTEFDGEASDDDDYEPDEEEEGEFTDEDLDDGGMDTDTTDPPNDGDEETEEDEEMDDDEEMDHEEEMDDDEEINDNEEIEYGEESVEGEEPEHDEQSEHEDAQEQRERLIILDIGLWMSMLRMNSMTLWAALSQQ